MGNRIVDLLGQRFGRLTVIKFNGLVRQGSIRRATWLCMCACGNEAVVSSNNLRRRSVKSCGCYKKVCLIKHGMTRSSEHSIWVGIRKRCLNEKDKAYEYYGGRGIKICDRWLESFENFYKDMGPRPSKNHSIDRIDNDGDYSPDNCRWATMSQQRKNSSTARLITHNGETKCLEDWAASAGITGNNLWKRLWRGWSMEKALNTPINYPRGG